MDILIHTLPFLYICIHYLYLEYKSGMVCVCVLNFIVHKRSSCYSFDDSKSVSQRNAGEISFT